jgi:hypothetical protein
MTLGWKAGRNDLPNFSQTLGNHGVIEHLSQHHEI